MECHDFRQHQHDFRSSYIALYHSLLASHQQPTRGPTAAWHLFAHRSDGGPPAAATRQPTGGPAVGRQVARHQWTTSDKPLVAHWRPRRVASLRGSSSGPLLGRQWLANAACHQWPIVRPLKAGQYWLACRWSGSCRYRHERGQWQMFAGIVYRTEVVRIIAVHHYVVVHGVGIIRFCAGFILHCPHIILLS